MKDCIFLVQKSVFCVKIKGKYSLRKEENDAGERSSNIRAECLRRKDGVGSSASVGFERNRTVNLLQQKEAKGIDPGTRALVRVRTDRSSLAFAFILTVK